MFVTKKEFQYHISRLNLLERDICNTQHETMCLREQYRLLFNKHELLLEHFNLVEKTTPKKTFLAKKDLEESNA